MDDPRKIAGPFIAFLISLPLIGGCYTDETVIRIYNTDSDTDNATVSDTGSATVSDTGSATVSDTDSNIDTNSHLLQHLDATVSGSVVTQASGVVALWKDLSSYSHHATPSRGKVFYPSAHLSVSGLAGLDLGTDQNELELLDAVETSALLDFTPQVGAAAGNSGFTLFVAFRVEDATEGDIQYVLGTRNSSNGFCLKISEIGKITFMLPENLPAAGSLIVESGDTIIAGFSYDAATGKSRVWESKNDLIAEKQQPVSGDWDANTNLRLGDVRTQDDAVSCFRGMVGEVKIFNAVLSAHDFDIERMAMATKWGKANE